MSPTHLHVNLKIAVDFLLSISNNFFGGPGGVQFVQVNFDSLEVQDTKPICSRQTDRLLPEKVYPK